MASTRKSRSVPKRFSKINEVSPDKDGGENKKGQKKRKLSDMLGSQWSKEELQRFYDAYRKYGKDWKKVAGVVRNRSIEMVEALYNMNRAYLSLPEGTASVVGLIAMMTDHYNILEGSESDRESNDGPGMSRKPQKRGRGKMRSNISKGLEDQIPDLLRSTPAASNYGCLSLLKKKRSAGSRPRAVGKRTPRYPVSRGHGVSLNRQGKKSEVDANDDEVAHGVVRVLAEALQRGGSPQVSQTPNKRKGLMRLSPLRDGERRRTESEMASAKLGGTGMDDDYLEGSLGSREAENGDFVRDTSYMMDTEGVGTVEVQQKGKKSNRKKPKLQDTQNDQFDEVREACSGTEEGLNANSAKEKVEDEVTDKKIGKRSPMGSRNRSRQLFFGDESSALDALCTLADLSMKFAPDSAIESESSAQVREEKLIGDIAEKSSTHEAMSGNHQRDKLKNLGVKERGDHMDGVRFNPLKRKRKSISSKLLRTEVQTASPLNESQKNEVPAEEGKKSTSKTKRIGHIAPLQKQGKSTRPPERSSSSTNQLKVGTDSAVSITQVPTVSQVNLPTKLRSRRKKAFVRKELKAPENIVDDRPNKLSLSIPDRALDLKQKLSRCLSSHMLRRWSAYEWFYGAIDYPWFAQNEFVEYLTHVGLGHVPRLTRVEWSVIRSSLGKPRRLCQQFLLEEKRKLEKYRESVRIHYTELRAGIREGLPTDLPQPLSVGQRVTACHPKTRELHDGSVLTVDRNKCRVQFDRPELGVEFVMDVDCTPLNPLEHLPEALRRQNLAANRLHDNSSDVILNGRSKDWKFGGFMRATPSENPDSTDGTTHMPLPSHPMNTLIKQAKVDTISAISQAKAAANEIFNAQKASYTHPCTLAQIQAREADVRALSELGRALDRKEMLVLELRHMNDEVLENQKDGDNTLKDSESFKKQYAMILVQLKEANDQVSSALLYLRQRNTYTENSPSTWQKPGANAGNLVRPVTSFDQSAYLPQESGSRVLEILQTSRIKANTMVDAAVQAMSSLKDGEDAFSRVGDALDSATNRQHGPDSDVPTMRSIASPDPGHGSSGIQNTTNFRTSESTMTALNANGLNPTHVSERSEVQIPSELISSCVATLVMIQTCTERQYPPAEVAQILDSAVSNLQPYCSQNIPIYREIQMCMGLVKNQILALIPT